MPDFRAALRECQNGNLRMTQDSEGHRLFCYTKQCFFGKDTWNDVTTTHRGQLYFENKPVNKPFKKIFNVNEVDSTDHDLVCERMKNEPYEILDKANGHLFIVSMFKDSKGEQHVVFSTKGSLPNPDNDLLNDDIKIFISLYGDKMDQLCNKMPYTTLMFEAIVSHDKHSMYDLQVEQYGSENCFVLLGASIGLGYEHGPDVAEHIFHSKHNNTTLLEDPWVESNWDSLNNIATFLECPVVQKYDEVDGTPEMWKEHTDREGYVIHFLTNNDRVKIKTNEYWQNRFKKDLTPEVILSTFKSGGIQKLKDKLPEEIANQCVDKLTELFWLWHDTVLCDSIAIRNFLTENNYTLNGQDRKWLFTESDFNQYERNHIVAFVDGSKKDLMGSKDHRNNFYEWAIQDDVIYDNLKDIVYNAL